MLTNENQINILVHLSMADSFVAEEEIKLIKTVGKRMGMTESQIEELIKNPQPIPNVRDLPAEEKFDYLYNVIQLMKVDGKIYQSEIQFCEKLAIGMGYKAGVVADLSAYIYSDPSISTNRSYLRSIADKHLVPRK